MTPTISRIIICGLPFLLTLISGLWLSNAGKPLNGIIFTIHKLTALTTTVVIAASVFHLYKGVDMRVFVELSVIAVTALLFLSLLVSGALLSLGKPAPLLILRIHQVAPLLALLLSAATLYLLLSRRVVAS